jgi:beta-glucosidase
VIALEDTTPIPAQHLRPAEGEGVGLLGEYFTNLTFDGAPAMRRVEAVNFRWATGPPAERFPSEGFSVRWSGTLEAPATGRYVLSLASNDGGRLYLDDRLIVDVWGDHATLTGTAIVDLSDRPHRVRIEYYEKQGNADIVLGWRRIEGNPLDAAVEAARRADVAVVFAGFSEALETEAKDRADLYLPEAQESLIAAVAAANRNSIVVLNSGGPVLIERWVDQVPAILQAFYLGQEGGTALAEVLLGERSPKGKLPFTVPRRWDDSPAFGRYPGEKGVVRYGEGIMVGYRHFDRAAIEPRYPFGHGLSYASFEYDSPAVHQSENSVNVEFGIQNTGTRAGSEIVQVYIHRPQSRIPRPSTLAQGAPSEVEGRPVRELKAFRNVTLGPGERQRVSIDLPREAFARYDPQQRNRIVTPGRVELQVGSSSRAIRFSIGAEIR